MATSGRIDELRKRYEENQRRFFAPLANEYRKAGDLEQAIALCRMHLAEVPANLSGQIVFGQALFESGALDDARSAFETAVGLDPENLIGLRHLGDIARLQSDVPRARAWYQRVLDADRRNEEVLALMAELDAEAAATAPPASEPASAEGAPEAAPEPRRSHAPPLIEMRQPEPAPEPALDVAPPVAPLRPTPVIPPSLISVDAPTIEIDVIPDLPPIAERIDTAVESASGVPPAATEAVDTLLDFEPTSFTPPAPAEPAADFGFEPTEIATAPASEVIESLVEPILETITEPAIEPAPDSAADATTMWIADPDVPPSPEPAFDLIDVADEHSSSDTVPSTESALVADEEAQAAYVADTSFGFDLDLPVPAAAVETPMLGEVDFGMDSPSDPATDLDESALAMPFGAPASEIESAPAMELEPHDEFSEAPSSAFEPAPDEPAPIAEMLPAEFDLPPANPTPVRSMTPAAPMTPIMPMTPVIPMTPVRSMTPVIPVTSVRSMTPVVPAPILPPTTPVEDMPAVPATPFATETMAELYVRQGLRQEAIAIYRQLVAARPGETALAQRLAELEHEGLAPASSTARSFFASLSSRRATPRGLDAIAAEPDVANASASGSVEQLFGRASVGAHDESVARALARAYDETAAAGDLGIFGPSSGSRGPTQP